MRKKNKTWKDITIRQHMEMLPSNFKNKGELETVFSKLKTLGDIELEEAMKMTKGDVDKFLKKFKFMSEAPSGKMKHKFKLDGVIYTVDADINNHKADNYMFIMDRLKDLSKNPEAVDQNLHLIMAVVCHPMKRKFYHKGKFFKLVKDEDNNIMETAQIFYEKMTVDIAYPISIFFCKLSKSLTPIINDCLTQIQATTKSQ